MKRHLIAVFFMSLCANAHAAHDFNYSGYNARNPKNTLLRKNFFKNIVGIPERTFQRQFGWNKRGELANLNRIKLDQWIADYPNRAAIFQGGVDYYTLGQMKEIAKQQVRKANDAPRFEIKFYDPAHPERADIRYNQALKKHKGHAFQLASTPFGPLEGGMCVYLKPLTSMLEAPVQGEEASMSTAGATIYRKYFMPNIPPNSGYYYLLENLPVKDICEPDGTHFISLASVKRYKYNPTDVDKVGIATHKNIVVSSGYGPGVPSPRPHGTDNYPEEKLNILFDENDQIDTDNTQIITHVFATAYDMTRAIREAQAKKMVISSAAENFAKLLLNAAYYGSIIGAYLAGAPYVHLTLMGGGAFRNDIDWIGQAIARPEIKDFIKQTGMHASILYRPDKPRDNAVRTKEGDKQFIMRMLEMADEINNTQLASNPRVQELVEKYTTEAYKPNYEKNMTLSRYAQELNALFDQTKKLARGRARKLALLKI